MIHDSEQLRERIEAAAVHAARSGALRPIATRTSRLLDAGVEFVVRLVLPCSETPRPMRKADPLANPFLPFDPDLHVADLSPTHIAILNKYNVLDRHLLIITRDYRDQEEWLTPADFAALLQCMAVFPSMGFYNAGRAAGASQPHKHLQVVPLPLSERGPRIPVEPLLAAARLTPQPGRAAALPYEHAVLRADPAWWGHPGGADAAYDAYRALLTATALARGLTGRDGDRGPPYNLVLTRDWMLLVPRARETFYTITINSLGVVGAMLVKDEERLRLLQRHGPAAALRHVTGRGG